MTHANSHPPKPDHFQKLAHPLFILSIFLLFLNDRFLKDAYPGTLTGKISDFSGLFAAPFLFSTIFPKQRKIIHWLIALTFIYWKSEFSQPLIDMANGIGIPAHRVVDVTDNIALVAVCFSYLILNERFNVIWQPIPRPLTIRALIAFSLFNFAATSMVPREDRTFLNVNKTYTFPISKRELISRLNMIQMKEVNYRNKMGGHIDFDSETNVFHYHNQTDTLALLLDPKKVADQDLIKLKTSLAEIQISGNNSSSQLKLVTVTKTIRRPKDKDYRTLAIKSFEKRIVKKIKNYGHPLY